MNPLYLTSKILTVKQKFTNSKQILTLSLKRRLENNLHLSNSHLQRALTLCYDNFSSKRLINMQSLTAGKNQQISNLPGLVKFNLKQEEEALKNSFYPKIIALFGTGASARVFEQSESFRSCLKCIVEQSLQAWVEHLSTAEILILAISSGILRILIKLKSN